MTSERPLAKTAKDFFNSLLRQEADFFIAKIVSHKERQQIMEGDMRQRTGNKSILMTNKWIEYMELA